VTQGINACDNLRGIGLYLESIRSVLEDSVPEMTLGRLTSFYNDVLPNFLHKFSQFVFPYFIPGLVKLQAFDSQVRALKWNITEAVTEPHGYVETWKGVAIGFGNQLKGLELEQLRQDELWLAFWRYTSLVLLNAFSSTTKCTPNGRTAMRSDFGHLVGEFGQLTGKRLEREIDQTWMANYILAFFNNVNEFKTWVQKDYKKYSRDQLLALVETGFNDEINRQTKKDLRTFVQNLYSEPT
jgi:hypothetical protein